MKAPIPMPADEILFAEMSQAAKNNTLNPQRNAPGSNPWLKYLIVGGLIGFCRINIPNIYYLVLN
jgi:hypothetical protein